MKKNIKEKLIELKITDDMEDESGIDSISLVDTPAIEVNWVAFSKEKPENFHIPDGEDDSYLDRLTPYGEDEQSLFDEGFEVASIDYLNQNNFIYSYPNRESDLDTNLFRVRYKYVLNPQAGGQPITATTRKFCADLIRKNLVFRLEDMLNQQNDQGSSFADWRGGYNCRHIFARIIYKKKGKIENNAGGKREDGYDILGSPQNDTTVPEWPSFDWKTLSSEKFQESYSDYPESVKNNAKRVLKWVEENGWGSCGTAVGKQRANQLAKGEPISRETVKRMYSYLSRHKKDLETSKGYDDGCGKLMYDSWGGLTALRWAESKVNSFGYENNLPPYVDQLPKKKKKKLEEEFDYLKTKNTEKQAFSTDEEKRMVVGPAMIPDQEIFRRDIFGNPYYVFFSPESIKMIMEKYMKNKYLDNNDLMHDGNPVNDVYVVESWIIEDPETDKSKKYGYNLPAGTWMVAMKCAKTPKGDEVWNKIKNKELNGFSVSGFFIEEEASFKEELFLHKVAEILKNVKE